MILPLFLIRLFFLRIGSALDLHVGKDAHLIGAVILVVDSIGALHIPEHTHYFLDGLPWIRPCYSI